MVHKSATSCVLTAIDTRCEAGQNESRVALKFMKDETQFFREQEARRGLPEKCVISILADGVYDGRADPSFIEGVKKQDALSVDYYCYLLVFLLSEKSLQDMILHDNLCRDLEHVRVIFSEICQCLGLLHTAGAGRIHGDIKPLNIMRGHDGRMILIDLDASVVFGEACGIKESTAYFPPEMFDGREIRRPGGSTALAASASFDMWSLGVVLYELCTGSKLWKSDVQDNIDNVKDVDDLSQWTLEIKTERLQRITDPVARNLVSQLLSKDPALRPDVAHILSHPFITGHVSAARLPGQKPTYDVFLSYRVAADKEITKAVYEALTNLGMRVYWDYKCIPVGKEWEIEFVLGLFGAAVFVPIISKEAINHSSIAWQNFTKLTEGSDCDNVLLEHRLALELHMREMVTDILPVFVGDVVAGTPHRKPYSLRGADASHPQLGGSHVVVASVEKKAHEHLENNGLGSPLRPNMSVDEVLTELCKYQGRFYTGAPGGDIDFIVEAVLEIYNRNNAGPTHVAVVDTQAGEKDRIIAELESKLEQVESEKDQLKQEKEQLEREHSLQIQELLARLSAFDSPRGEND